MSGPGTYAVTGACSGMGLAVAERLRAAGHRVIAVDRLPDADVVADLATPAGRRAAGDAVLEEAERSASGSLEGAVFAAGLGPASGPAELIMQVNYFGTVELLRAWRPALARAEDAKVVAFGSNSATTTPLIPRRAIAALLRDDVPAAVRALQLIRSQAPTMGYAASKVAVSRWARRHAVAPEWAGAGIRLNVLAPGAVETPLLDRQRATPDGARQIRSFPVPIGHLGDPVQLAAWVEFMLSPAADFLCGSVVVVDGGSDAWFRADDWPRPVPFTTLRRYLRRFRSGPRPTVRSTHATTRS